MKTIKGRAHNPTARRFAAKRDLLTGVAPIGKLVLSGFPGDGASMYLHGHQSHVEFINSFVETPYVGA